MLLYIAANIASANGSEYELSPGLYAFINRNDMPILKFMGENTL